MPKRTPPTLFSAMSSLRSSLTGTSIRVMAGLRDAGAAFWARVRAPESGPATRVADDRSDVWVSVAPVMGGPGANARLYSPGNMLWRLPPEDDHVTVIRPGDVGGPGSEVALHGDGGSENDVPEWLAADRCGISPPTGALRLESRDGDVEVQTEQAGKKVTLQGGGRGVARMDDTVNCGTLVFTAVGTGVLAGTYTDPSGTSTPFSLSTPIPITGKINSASSKVEADQ